MKTNNKVHCMYCGEALIGRADKKFCNAGCRALFHHARRRQRHPRYCQVMDALKKNRRILLQINPSGFTSVRTTYLQAQGFDFSCFTNRYVTPANEVFYFCFEIGYKFLDADKVFLMHWQPYLEFNANLAPP